MVARAPVRSQVGANAARAKAEARRRAADHQAEVEEVLSTYLVCGEEAVRLRQEVERAEAHEAEALAELAHLVGRSRAAEMAQVEEARVRSALARRRTAPSSPRRQRQSGSDPDPPDGVVAVSASVSSPGES